MLKSLRIVLLNLLMIFPLYSYGQFKYTKLVFKVLDESNLPIQEYSVFIYCMGAPSMLQYNKISAGVFEANLPVQYSKENEIQNDTILFGSLTLKSEEYSNYDLVLKYSGKSIVDTIVIKPKKLEIIKFRKKYLDYNFTNNTFENLMIKDSITLYPFSNIHEHTENKHLTINKIGYKKYSLKEKSGDNKIENEVSLFIKKKSVKIVIDSKELIYDLKAYKSETGNILKLIKKTKLDI